MQLQGGKVGHALCCKYPDYLSTLRIDNQEVMVLTSPAAGRIYIYINLSLERNDFRSKKVVILSKSYNYTSRL